MPPAQGQSLVSPERLMGTLRELLLPLGCSTGDGGGTCGCQEAGSDWESSVTAPEFKVLLMPWECCEISEMKALRGCLERRNHCTGRRWRACGRAGRQERLLWCLDGNSSSEPQPGLSPSLQRDWEWFGTAWSKPQQQTLQALSLLSSQVSWATPSGN